MPVLSPRMGAKVLHVKVLFCVAMRLEAFFFSSNFMCSLAFESATFSHTAAPLCHVFSLFPQRRWETTSRSTGRSSIVSSWRTKPQTSPEASALSNSKTPIACGRYWRQSRTIWTGEMWVCFCIKGAVSLINLRICSLSVWAESEPSLFISSFKKVRRLFSPTPLSPPVLPH